MRDDFLRVDPDRHLVLNWSYFPSTGGYFFRLHFKDEHQSIESDFSALAARAGRITTKYPNPTQGWFHLIATYKGLNVEKLQMKDPQTGMVKACLNGQTDRLSEISAILCSRYEKLMVEEISIRRFASAHMPAPEVSLSDRLDTLVAESDITHEALAHRMKLGKTAYFAVKRGEGGKSSKIKVSNYLDKYYKNHTDNSKKRTKTN